MKKLHKISLVLSIVSLAFFAVSCLPDQESIGGAGQTFVKLHPADYSMSAFDAKTTPQSGILFEVRRDVANSNDLNSSTTVELLYDTDNSIMDKYNEDNETSYTPLPTSLGTVSPAITGGKITLTFAPGEIGKTISINVPSAGSFDFSKNYALAFKINSVSGTGKLSEAVGKTILCEVLAKNKWDGVYTVTGSFVDYINSAWVGYYPKEVELRTTGANTCSKYDKELAGFGYLFDTDGAGTLSQFGAWTPAFIFDSSDNVTVVNTTVDSPARGRTAELYTGVGAINKYDAKTKTMDVAYYLKQLNVSPQLRSLVKEHYVYKGAR
jgi:Domain of unknown function (DUF1735).